jgi:hypothetical protein
MSRRKAILFLAALAIIVSGGLAVLRLKATQRVGAPGLKVSRMAGTDRLQIDLPGQVLEYHYTALNPMPEEEATLPPDTTFGRRVYSAPDGFNLLLSIVMMGADRTSIHKPQFCLVGQGWTIDQSETVRVTMNRPHAYELPVMKLLATKQFVVDGRPVQRRGVYLYWFVADHAVTADHGARMWRMGMEMLRTGVLQRWAYVICFADCAVGDEDRTFNRLKDFMVAAVPEFQLATLPPEPGSAP